MSDRQIISASRRTDIAAFYSRWFLQRLEAGLVRWRQPYGGGERSVSLLPEDCLALVFWTRDPGPLLPALGDITSAGHVPLFQVTVTGYPRELEPRAPRLEVGIERLRAVGEKLGPEAVVWRYDPIVVSSLTPPALHLERFERIARELGGAAREVTVSFVDLYGKTRRNLERLERERGVVTRDPEIEERRELVKRLAEIADRHRLALTLCCEDELVEEGRAAKARCVDLARIERLRGEVEERPARRPTRKGCGCSASVDIGAYDTCPFGCLYCYATRSREAALARFRAHRSSGEFLVPPPPPALATSTGSGGEEPGTPRESLPRKAPPRPAGTARPAGVRRAGSRAEGPSGGSAWNGR